MDNELNMEKIGELYLFDESEFIRFNNDGVITWKTRKGDKLEDIISRVFYSLKCSTLREKPPVTFAELEAAYQSQHAKPETKEEPEVSATLIIEEGKQLSKKIEIKVFNIEQRVRDLFDRVKVLEGDQ